MLPEVLSNEICSLQPGENRFTYSVFIEINSEGKIKSYTLEPSVIRSNARLTYVEAQDMILSKKSDKISKMIKEMAALKSILKSRRLAKGSLDFDLPEVIFSFDPLGILEDIKPKMRLESHDMVEEFMLLANQVVAQYCESFEKTLGESLPFIYRNHEPPGHTEITEFARLLNALGIPFTKTKKPVPKSFQNVLNYVKDTQEERLVEEIALRTMQKAVYAHKNKGHFALAFPKYTHFTSPIRRYPDLMVHRLLKSYQNKQSTDIRVLYGNKLKSMCDHLSDMERRALEAEREAVKIKQLEFMKDHLGDEFEGIISGVTNYGLFVEIEGILAEGLIHIRDLNDDYYTYDEKHYCLSGQYSNKTYRLGNPILVQVARVDTENKFIDFIPVEKKTTRKKKMKSSRK